MHILWFVEEVRVRPFYLGCYSAFEAEHRFHVEGLRKEVEQVRLGDAEARAREHLDVARQCGRIARDVC